MSNDMKNNTPGAPVGEVGITPTPGAPVGEVGITPVGPHEWLNDAGDIGNCPAFPLVEPWQGGNLVHFGMSLRDWFAGQALAATFKELNGCFSSYAEHHKCAADMAYDVADAMLKARKGGGT